MNALPNPHPRGSELPLRAEQTSRHARITNQLEKIWPV
jgi:hypothetical protein